MLAEGGTGRQSWEYTVLGEGEMGRGWPGVEQETSVWMCVGEVCVWKRRLQPSGALRTVEGNCRSPRATADKS